MTGPRPLLTNPHPTAARITPRTAAHLPPVPPALLAINPKLTPQTLALYAMSQRGSYRWWGVTGLYGWGPYGGLGWGWGGYPRAGWGFYGFSPFGLYPWGWGPGWGWGSGFGIGFGYQSGPWAFGLGYGFGYRPAIAYVPVYVEAPAVVADPNPNPPLQPIPEATLPAPAPAEKPAEPEANFAERGQELFLAGRYAEAAKVLRHAVVDDPRNGPLLALAGEALWAAGNYNEAAGAIQQSLLATPEADWVGVSSRAARLIPSEAVLTLAKALADKEAPDMRFLAAYQSFGAGKYDEARAHLDAVLEKAPDDQVAKKLREQAARLGAGK